MTHYIVDCQKCPFKKEIKDFGYSSTDCTLLSPYTKIAKDGIRNDCPLKKENITIALYPYM